MKLKKCRYSSKCRGVFVVLEMKDIYSDKVVKSILRDNKGFEKEIAISMFNIQNVFKKRGYKYMLQWEQPIKETDIFELLFQSNFPLYITKFCKSRIIT